MILTNCAACAAPLALNAPRCVRCQTRYCNKTCQHDHWRRGHKQICKKIFRGGGAEQYNAEKKYQEAATAAKLACAADTEGQTCYICMEGAVRRHAANEGLVRMCACQGSSTGFAHLSCLVEQAKILVAEDQENNFKQDKWVLWSECQLCKERYQGAVSCALGWACWKAYASRPAGDLLWITAMARVAEGTLDPGEQLCLFETALATRQHYYPFDLKGHLAIKSNIADCYKRLGNGEEALSRHRDAYRNTLALHGAKSEASFRSARQLTNCLQKLGRYAEASKFCQEQIPLCERALGSDHDLVVDLQEAHAFVLLTNFESTLDEVHEGLSFVENWCRYRRRTYGSDHPHTKHGEKLLKAVKAFVASREEFAETLRKKGVVSAEDQREIQRQLAARHKARNPKE